MGFIRKIKKMATLGQGLAITPLHGVRQEAQLPLRNRASAMHLFVAKSLCIAVITYNCV